MNPSLEMRNIVKEFPGVRALRGANLVVYPHSILGLVGENGAGKSTLMKILVGVQAPDSGEIVLHGRPVRFRSVREAALEGVGMVFQEQSLLSNMTVAENLVMAHEDLFSRGGLIRWGEVERTVREALRRLHLDDLDPGTRLGDLSMAKRQLVEVARLVWLAEHLAHREPVIVLDEPTTVLNKEEADILFETLRDLRARASVIFISHRLEEVLELSDHVVVMRDGKDVVALENKGLAVTDLHKHMVGRELATEYFLESAQVDPQPEAVLRVEGLGLSGSFEDVSFTLHRGEILSLVGTVGSGKEELCRAIMGLVHPDRGAMWWKGKPYKPQGPRDAASLGIGYVPEDRRDEGLFLYLEVAKNITLPRLQQVSTRGWISRRKEERLARHWVERLRIRTPSVQALCMNLSGGNQQKVVLAKWLAAQVDLLILDHPTRGIDVGAKQEVYRIIRDLARQGLAMLLMSDTLEEDIGLSNRILVLKDGRVTGEFSSARGRKPAPVDLIEAMV